MILTCPTGSISTGMRPRRFVPKRATRWLRRGSSAATPRRSMPKAARPAGWSRTARASVAGAVGALARNVVFTSGGTEANALALTPGLRRGSGLPVERLVVSAIEHASVLAGGRFPPEAIGTVGVTRSGLLDLDRLRAVLAERAAGAGFGDAGQQRNRRGAAGGRNPPKSSTPRADCCMSMRSRRLEKYHLISRQWEPIW